MPISPECNFIFLAKNYQYLAHSACIAESCLYSDPHNCIIKMGILNEEICRIICDKCEIEINKKDKFAHIVHRLKKIFFTEEDASTYMKIEDIAKSRNIAAHNIPKDEKAFEKYRKIALQTLCAGYQLSKYFYIRFINSDYQIPEFHLPKAGSMSEESDVIKTMAYEENLMSDLNEKYSMASALGGDQVSSLLGTLSKTLTKGSGSVLSESVKSAARSALGGLPGLGAITGIGLGLAGAYIAGKSAKKAVKILPDSINAFFKDLEIDSDVDVS